MVLVWATALLLVGCAAEPVTGDARSTPDAASSGGEHDPSEDQTVDNPETHVERVQDETCGWDTPPRASSSVPALPSGSDDELSTVVVGAWQHTHYDSGDGYRSLDDEDIRYIFPSPERLLYCQNVPGATDQAQNGADISWEETSIVLPGGTVAFTVNAWNDDIMIWINHADGSRYLLQRR